MKKITMILRVAIENLMNRLGWGMRAKLIVIFLFIKVIPIVLLTYIAWRQFDALGSDLALRMQDIASSMNEALSETGEISVNNSVAALNDRATEDIERMTTDAARAVAEFLYGRDDDILFLAAMTPDAEGYRRFAEGKRGRLIKKGEWALAPDGEYWVPVEAPRSGKTVGSSNRENDRSFQYRQPDPFEYEYAPLYLEAAFIDLDGNEVIKAVTSERVSGLLKNVSDRRNTFAKAETYFEELKGLAPGEIYVSEVIGTYVPSRHIGMYTPENLAARGLEFQPEEDAYAGMENPNGRRFEGIVRWATPVIRSGEKIGYVTLALNHDHIMEFTDHLMPTQDRYTELPNAYEGNYAFIWDYKCRSICHPRHHSITGYDPETGEPQVPWLEESIYEAWQESGKGYVEFIKDQPTFVEQSVNKRPAPALTEAGLVGLDGRYLNFAPQCTGWFDLTSEGGSGSFLILWSGLTKLTTAAAIPYYTGRYGESKRGFGVVTIGAGLDYFQRPAMETKEELDSLIAYANDSLRSAEAENSEAISKNLQDTAAQLVISAGAMIVLVVLIAIWMASVFTDSVTSLIKGIARFHAGERQFRFNAPVKDELGTLADEFDEMADSIEASVSGLLCITDMDKNIIYMNDKALGTLGMKLEDVIGTSYNDNSIYPADSEYCPIRALKESREASVCFLEDFGRYVKGSAAYLVDRNGKEIGYVVTTTDVTEMAKQQQDLEKAVTEANRANEHKGDFLARMSHEIRTPMNAIIGMTNIVKRKLSEGHDMGEIQAHVRQIESSSTHLLGLLNDILDISKIEAGKIDLSEEPVDLRRLAVTVVGIIKPRCDEKGVTFGVLFESVPPVTFVSDSLRLRQVLINLLGNAVKFTPEGGRVEFRMECPERRDGRARVSFTVSDTGIGISEEALPKLFQRFEQGGRDISRQYGGTGLGLVISKKIVQLLGGDIAVKSKAGEGSEFSFEIWLRESGEIPYDETAADTFGKFTDKRALLVDDVPINRLIARDMLESAGMSVDEAEDGRAALKLFEGSPENAYDVIFMDVQMPGMNGYEAAMRIRALGRADSHSVPIIALTANAFKEDIDEALAHGMNAHVAKPLEAEKLLEVMLRFMGKG
ncbi:MAG: response regulator [Synergistaceae bacterium]|jgi:signal transduction histidine kinase/CheY-like chemotaxis protein/HAMP domain-containing protein|nr:response regulator [Synergistaceae bacterium]